MDALEANPVRVNTVDGRVLTLSIDRIVFPGYVKEI